MSYKHKNIILDPEVAKCVVQIRANNLGGPASILKKNPLQLEIKMSRPKTSPPRLNFKMKINPTQKRIFITNLDAGITTYQCCGGL